VSGQFIRCMPVAVVFTIGASLLVSLTIVPFLASRLLLPQNEHGNVFYRAMTWAIEGTYRRILRRAVARPRTTLLIAAALFAGSLALVPRIGFSLFPKAGVPQFMVRVEASEGASLAETDRAARFVESVLARHPEISNVATTFVVYPVSRRSSHSASDARNVARGSTRRPSRQWSSFSLVSSSRGRARKARTFAAVSFGASLTWKP